MMKIVFKLMITIGFIASLTACNKEPIPLEGSFSCECDGYVSNSIGDTLHRSPSPIYNQTEVKHLSGFEYEIQIIYSNGNNNFYLDNPIPVNAYESGFIRSTSGSNSFYYFEGKYSENFNSLDYFFTSPSFGGNTSIRLCKCIKN